MKRIFTMTMVLLAMLVSGTTAWAADVTYSPVLDVNFRTTAGNTGWQTVKNAADEGNTDFELTSTAGFFALQKYTVSDLQNVSKMVLTLTVGSKSGVDAVRLWSLPITDWTASTGVDDIVPKVSAVLGVDLRATEGTPNEPLVKGAKVAGSSPAQVTYTITGTALAAIKANADSDGTFTLLLTNDNLTNTGNKRSYLSNNTANAESSRPTLVATVETPAVKNVTTGDTYGNLTDAFNAAVTAGTDAELEIYEDVTLTSRLTLNKAIALTITPKADITIKGHRNQMWFLANVNGATLNIGASDHSITLDGQSNTFEYDVTKYENAATIALTNVTFQNFDLNQKGHLVGSKNNEGQIILDCVTFKNCSNPANAFIDKQRVTNDRVVLKGYLNQESCTGATVYVVSETKTSGTTGRIKVDDNNFTASAPITIEWPGTKAAGIVVVIGTTAANADLFQLTDADWLLERKQNGDLVMAAPVEPTAKIGEANYATLADALAAATDGDVITLLGDQELAARVNVKNMDITIDGQGQYTISRASSYKNGLVFLTQKPDEGLSSALTLKDVTLDGQNLESNAAFIEASNNGTTTLQGVTVQNVVTTADASIINKSGGKLVLNGVTFKDNTTGKADVFQGTSLTLLGENTIGSIYVEKQLTIAATGATVPAGSPIALLTDDSRKTGLIVIGGSTTDFTSTAFRLSQQSDGIYAMPQSVAKEYAHPGLLHTAADIARVKENLGVEPFKAAYAQLEAASAGTAAGAVELLKRMDQANWSATYSDYNNFSRAATDARLAYELALRYQLKGSTAAATAAVAILNNWATVNKGVLRLTGYPNNIPDPNEYLITIQAYQFANAAELLRDYTGWQAADFQKFQTWMRETFADVAYQFLENHHGNADTHYWLNWDMAALTAMYSVGVLCDDASLVDYALNYTAHGTGMGSIANAVPYLHNDPDSDEQLGQCQESGRDQGHSTLDVTLLGALCQMAQSQGTDLFTPYHALEMAEYVGKYNLKNADGSFAYADVPFTAYDNGEYQHAAISADGRGSERTCWELFHAYAKNNDKADAYTEGWVKYLREKNAYGEGPATTTDEVGFGTLMFGYEVSVPAITVTVNSASREYGEANPEFTYEVTGGTLEQLGGQIELTCEAVATSPVGQYAIRAAKGTATYRNIVLVDGTLTVTKAPLTISAGQYTMHQGEALPEFAATFEGFKNGETQAVLTVQPVLTTTATSESEPGKYIVNVGGAEATNYDITYVSGTLTIELPTGISAIGLDASQMDVYDLRGQKMSGTLKKGVYIVNGKKTVVK